MQWLGTTFNGSTLMATDGMVGELVDLLFDTETFHVRWLVVAAGRWLGGGKILIPPSTLQRRSGVSATLRVNLTQSHLRACPLIDTIAPISTQVEQSLNAYYGVCADGRVALQRGDCTAAPTRPYDISVAGRIARHRQKLDEANLRSVTEVDGYVIRATDGDAGFLKNVIFDDDGWRVTAMVVDLPMRWSPRDVLVPAWAIERVSRLDRRIMVNLPRKDIQGCVVFSQRAAIGNPYKMLVRAYRAWTAQTPEQAQAE